MAKINGQLLICDKCGKTHFRKYIGKGVTDGGYTTWDMFEEQPTGWEHHDIVGFLCPDCNNALNKLLDCFLHQPEEVVERKSNSTSSL